MKLSRLVEGLPIERTPGAGAGADPEITGVAHDSRRVAAGDLFVAWQGEHFDGTRFAPQAVAAGAVAVLGPTGSTPPVGLPTWTPGTPWLTAADPHRLLAPLALAIYDRPHEELVMAGVTGTNGKSTVSTLMSRLLETAGHPCGLIGSLGYFFGETRYMKDRTTPEGSDLFRLLRRMRQDGAAAVSMEVSSHALSLGRLEGARFDVAVFTNLSRDHFDFYADFEDYFQAKRRLFSMLEEDGGTAVNVEDPYGARLAAELPDTVTWGERSGAVHPLEATLDTAGIRGVLATPRGKLRFESQLLGRFNLLNILAAVAGAEALELSHGSIREGLALQRPLLGRMEPVEAGQPFPVYVDYSHTDGALAAALQSLRELTDRKLIVVFGCGGDKDPGKRPMMGRVAGELADLPIITSDNPRTEDPMKIIAAVEEGMRESGNTAYRVEPDRRAAIRLAMDLAAGEAVVLLAGKGDEPIQIIGEEEHPFYDYDEAVQALEARYGRASG